MSPIHKDGNELCFIYLLIYHCTTFNSRVNVLNGNTVRTGSITRKEQSPGRHPVSIRFPKKLAQHIGEIQ